MQEIKPKPEKHYNIKWDLEAETKLEKPKKHMHRTLITTPYLWFEIKKFFRKIFS